MSALDQFRLLLQVSRSTGIARRYFVVNGFDGALTMLGITTGFYLSGDVQIGIVITACLGATIALTMSGLTSAYLSETAERRKWLKELEEAMVSDLSASAHNDAARLVPIFVALVNGLAPLLVSLLIMLPLWLSRADVPLPLAPLESAIGIALVSIFGLGLFLGRVGGTSPFWSGIKAVLIALVTIGLIRWVGG